MKSPIVTPANRLRTGSRNTLAACLLMATVIALMVPAGCLHDKYSANDTALYHAVKARIVDSRTDQPIAGGYVFIVDRWHSKADKETCSSYKKLDADGVFTLSIERGNQQKTFWFLAPGYKSAVLTYDKKWRVLGQYMGSSTHSSVDGAFGAAVFLLSMIPLDSDLKTDFDSGITTVPLTSFQGKTEYWRVELNLGLAELKKAASGQRSSPTLERFIGNERQSIRAVEELQAMED